MIETEVLLTKSGKPRKRRPKKKIDYFDINTQKAILKFRECRNEADRQKIYREQIHNAFYKLAENIIFTYNFTKTGTDNLEDLKYEVISFLLPRIDLYVESKGKAYSYFGTIAKRYLIMQSQKNEVRISRQEARDFGTKDENLMDPIDELYEPLDTQQVYEEFLMEVDKNLFDLFDSIEEIKAADALLEIFRKRDELLIINKKAIYLYVKEMADVNSVNISNVIKVFKVIYKRILNKYIDNIDQPYLL